jgi:RNA polymerase sigma-70 factor (ECF subfamily)
VYNGRHDPFHWEANAFLDYASLEDEALIRLVANARSEALSVLYDRYNRLVFSMAFNSVGDMDAAEEITQDVFLRVWKNANSYRAEKAQVSTWISSITRYRAIDFLRKRGSRLHFKSLSWEKLTPNSIPNEDTNPEESTERSLTVQRVKLAVANLPDEQKQALSLAYFYGLTHSQIAEYLEQPLGTIKTRIRLGMQKLRKALSEDRQPDE